MKLIVERFSAHLFGEAVGVPVPAVTPTVTLQPPGAPKLSRWS